MSQGNIVQCIGAVVDIQFPSDAIPKIYDALLLDKSEEHDGCEADLIFEVQQQLGDGIVRTIAMGSSDGLRRGMKVNNTGAAISVPVGDATIGRIVNVLGRPIDEAGPIATEERRAIHQPAPKFDELSPSVDLLETGIKVIDLVCPFAKGGKVGLFGGAGRPTTPWQSFARRRRRVVAVPRRSDRLRSHHVLHSRRAAAHRKSSASHRVGTECPPRHRYTEQCFLDSSSYPQSIN